MKLHYYFAVTFFVSFLLVGQVVAKKKDDRSVIKVKEGDTISLSCDRGTVTQETLYAVKWYKDEKEFFRNYPKADNPVKVYPIEGFTLEQPLPTPWQVVLQNVNASATGKYTCMVVDYPRYRTIYKSTQVEVASKNDTLNHQSDNPGRRNSSSSLMVTTTFSLTCVLIGFLLVFDIK